MRFTLFMIIVLGVFLLAMGKSGSDSVVGFKEEITERYLADDLNKPESEPSEVVDQEPIAEKRDAELAATGDSKQPEPGEQNVDQPGSEETNIDAVLTKSEAYTREQLARYSPPSTGDLATIRETKSATEDYTYQDLHKLHREALSTLSRVDAVLHGNTTGAKK